MEPRLTNEQLAFQHMFTNISRGNDRFRALTIQYQSVLNALSNLKRFWIVCGLAEIGASIEAWAGFHSGFIVIFCLFVGVLEATIYALRNRRKLLNILLYSLINLLCYLSICLVITAFNHKNLLIPTLLYICSQTIISICLISDRNKFFPKFLLMLQLLIIALKLDNRISSQWIQVYFGFILVFFVAVVVFISMLTLWSVNVLLFKEKVFSVKNIGLGFISLNSISGVFISMMPISKTFFGIEPYFVGLIGIILIFFTILFIVKGKIQLILFLCKVQKVKEFNQLIALVKMSQKISNNCVFVKKSQNWYERKLITDFQMNVQRNIDKKSPQKHAKQELITQNKNQKQSAVIQKQGKIEQKVNIPKCLICLELNASIIWMPCGHLTVCQICCDKVLQNKCCNCLLCKDIPQAIYQVDNDISSKTGMAIQNQGNNLNTNQSLSKFGLKQVSTKDLESFQQSLSGNIQQKDIWKNLNQQFYQNVKKGEILVTKYAYSIRIH